MPYFSPELLEKTQAFLYSCEQRGLKLATAESCTGGLFSALLTEIAGGSKVFTHGFVTYANEAKETMLGVSAADLKQHGAVSETVARAMAEGALEASGVPLSVAITGIAGPGGGSAEKPVGLVHFASARRGFSTLHQRFVFSGDRRAVRLQAIEAALELVQRQLAR
jgi:nicotinamide-nucleotide amidase